MRPILLQVTDLANKRREMETTEGFVLLLKEPKTSETTVFACI